MILQRIREAERAMMYDEYVDRVGEVVTGIVQQAGDRNNVLVDLGRVEALLPRSEQVDGERYEQGSRIKAVITEVRSGTKGPQVILSRRDPELIKTLFELEVPEIADGLVEIRGVAREPGYRSKIAVESHTQGVDPVGACVGPRGSRVRMVVSELRGEKIDIIPWNTEPARFVAKALSPARVREVFVDDETKEATVVVPDDQLALAIGKEGLNARLAARLTGWKVDIQSDSEFAQAEAAAAYGGGTDEEFTGRCAAMLSNGKRCPNAALPGSHYCGVAGPPGPRGHRAARRGRRSAEVDESSTRRRAEVAEAPRPSSRMSSEAVAAGEECSELEEAEAVAEAEAIEIAEAVAEAEAEEPRPRRSPPQRRTRALPRERAGQDVCGLRAQGAAGRAPALRRAGRGADARPQAARARRLHVPAAALLRAGGLADGRSIARCGAPSQSSRGSRASTLTPMADEAAEPNKPNRPVRPRQGAPGSRRKRRVVIEGAASARATSARPRATAPPPPPKQPREIVAPTGPVTVPSGVVRQGPLERARDPGLADHQDHDGPRGDGHHHADALRRGRAS